MPLVSLLDNLLRPARPFVIFQSSGAQTCLPLLRQLIARDAQQQTVLVCCLLYPPAALVQPEHHQNVIIRDRTADVPGFGGSIIGKVEAETMVNTAPPGPLTLVIDSIDTLAADIGSNSKTVILLTAILALLQDRPAPSRLVLHVNASLLGDHADVLPMLSSSRFSQTLVHVTAHPPILIRHLAENYSTPPPPISSQEKFWSVFLPFITRGPGLEAEQLLFGPNGEGTGGAEIVLDVLNRGVSEGGGTARKVARGVDRTVAGWKNGAPCDLSDLFSLASVFARKPALIEATPDPTQNLSFNLNLTTQQQQQRAQVPLPYAHEGKDQAPTMTPGAILYDPDSADDIDDDDPDEDLDI